MRTLGNMSLNFALSRALLGPLVALLGYQMVSDANFRPRIPSFGTYNGHCTPVVAQNLANIWLQALLPSQTLVLFPFVSFLSRFTYRPSAHLFVDMCPSIDEAIYLSVLPIVNCLQYVLGGGWDLYNTTCYVNASAVSASALARSDLTLPYLTLPYLTLPYLTLPYLTLP